MTSLLSEINESIKGIKLNSQLEYSGKVKSYEGAIIECDGFPANVGSICNVTTEEGFATAEIIGFRDGFNVLSMHNQGERIVVGAKVSLTNPGSDISVGNCLLGRVIDSLGVPLDNKPLPYMQDSWPLLGKQVNPLNRQPVNTPLDVGVRAINGLLTVGRGQRLGIIAGSGVGKSVLLGMMSRFTAADVVVVGLIGERAREVRLMVDRLMSSESSKKTIVIAVPADRSPLLRLRGANRATSIAEYFRSKGKNVLLIMDSLTRVAHAKREIGLAMGEHPTSKGYPPSVISMIPSLIERSGTGAQNEGSITAFYTVLADADDPTDPVVDTSRAILDGHILLSRDQAQMGIYPALDIPASISRVASEITTKDHQEAVRKFRRYVSIYNESRDLVLMGGYAKGQDLEVDAAIESWKNISEYISQEQNMSAGYDESKKHLLSLADSWN